VYARRMTHWLGRVYPDAAEPLRLAARCQHIRRWMIPRASYPMDRAGYHRWRTALYSFHADEAGKILEQAGYDPETIVRVRSLLKKEKLKVDPQMQALEDVICLVFLEYEFVDFAAKHEEAKLIVILRRTWAKMSPRGREEVLKINLPADARALVEKALAGPT
jgi:Domain of unknown function (DUF4202)